MPRIKQFDEQEVLNKAMELFWKQGFHATSIQDLVNHLGINRASLYDTFGGKRELYEKTLQEYRNRNRKIIVELLEEQPSVKQGLMALFELAVEKAHSEVECKGCFVVNTTTEFLPGDPKIEEEVTHNQKQFENLLENYIAKGIKKGEISQDKDPKSIASMLFLLYNGIQVITKVNANKEQLMNTIRTSLKVLD